jgi:hypothetical protein
MLYLGNLFKVIDGYGNNITIEKVGLCIAKDTGDFFGLEFDENINGHSCAGLGKDGYCWWFPRDCLERAPDEVVAIHCRVEIDEAL